MNRLASDRQQNRSGPRVDRAKPNRTLGLSVHRTALTGSAGHMSSPSVMSSRRPLTILRPGNARLGAERANHNRWLVSYWSVRPQLRHRSFAAFRQTASYLRMTVHIVPLAVA